MEQLPTTTREEAAKTLATIIYALYAVSFLAGVTAIFAIVINYLKRADVVGTFVESHFRWQMRTFWYGLLWCVIGMITAYIAIGWLVLFGNALWVIYRIVKGWLHLRDNQAMYVDSAATDGS